MPSIQDLVVPIVRYATESGSIRVLDLVGTATFLDAGGGFLTCGSVFRSSAPASGSSELGLMVRLRDGRSGHQIAPISAHEYAPAPVDLAVGRADVATATAFSIASGPTVGMVWRDVCAFGFVALEPGDRVGTVVPVSRVLRGNVQREAMCAVRARESVRSFELGFRIPRGMTGAPLFSRREVGDLLLGVCVGNTAPRTVEYLQEEGGAPEQVVESAGVAWDVHAVSGWRPQLLGGARLRDTFRP